MTKFTPIKNEVTGKTDYNFPATLKSVGTKVFENSNGTKYVLGTVDFTAPNGVEQKAVTTQIYEKSLGHGIKPGDTLLSTLSQGDDNKMYIRTSHLQAGNGIDITAFASLSFEAMVEQPAEVAATA